MKATYFAAQQTLCKTLAFHLGREGFMLEPQEAWTGFCLFPQESLRTFEKTWKIWNFYRKDKNFTCDCVDFRL